MSFRLSVDLRVLLPFVMLVGLATSVALSAAGPRGALHASARPSANDLAPRPRGTAAAPLPLLLDPSVSLKRAAPQVAPPVLGPFHGSALASERRREPDDQGPPAARQDQPPDDPCAEGMILIEGEYRPAVGHLCLRRIEGPVERCAEYASPAIVDGSAQNKRFCIDRFEYPNLEGVRPVVMVSWHD